MQIGFRADRSRSWIAAIALGTVLVAAPVRAQSNQNVDAGIGALSALATLFYAPVKLVYATTGLLIGGIAWGFSGGDAQVAKAVITPAVQGDYVITPDIIRGRRLPEFYGRDPRYRDSEVAQAPLPGPAAPLVEEEY